MEPGCAACHGRGWLGVEKDLMAQMSPSAWTQAVLDADRAWSCVAEAIVALDSWFSIHLESLRSSYQLTSFLVFCHLQKP